VKQGVRSIALSPDSTRIAVACAQDGLLHIYDAESLQLVSRYGTAATGMPWHKVGWLTPEKGRDGLYASVGGGYPANAAFLDLAAKRVMLLRPPGGASYPMSPHNLDVSSNGRLVLGEYESKVSGWTLGLFDRETGKRLRSFNQQGVSISGE